MGDQNDAELAAIRNHVRSNGGLFFFGSLKESNPQKT
jgi:hypothetical protein